MRDVIAPGIFAKHVCDIDASFMGSRRPSGRSPTQYPCDDENPRGLGFRLVRLQQPL